MNYLNTPTNEGAAYADHGLETICGVDCYEKDGTVYLNLEAVARGLGFTDNKGDAEYVRWSRVDKYLAELDFATDGERPDFIPENIFYRLAMKARRNVGLTKIQCRDHQPLFGWWSLFVWR